MDFVFETSGVRGMPLRRKPPVPVCWYFLLFLSLPLPNQIWYFLHFATQSWEMHTFAHMVPHDRLQLNNYELDLWLHLVIHRTKLITFCHLINPIIAKKQNKHKQNIWKQIQTNKKRNHIATSGDTNFKNNSKNKYTQKQQNITFSTISSVSSLTASNNSFDFISSNNFHLWQHQTSPFLPRFTLECVPR